MEVACGHVVAQTAICCESVSVDIDRHVAPTEHHPDHRHPTRRR